MGRPDLAPSGLPGRRRDGGLVLERTAPVDDVATQYPDHTVFQTRAWLGFVAETQGGEVVHADVRREGQVVGHFSGVLVRRYGLRVLGSPLPGSTTSCSGFNLLDDRDRLAALSALRRFAFRELGCQHVEVMDRRVDVAAAAATGWPYRAVDGFEVDLSPDEDDVFRNFTSSCRESIRRATRRGVVAELADDAAFADEYYAQLEDVFAKRGLVPTYGKDRVQALLRHLHGTGNLLTARSRTPAGEPAATLILVGSNDLWFAWGGASWRFAQRWQPNEPLMWFAVRRLKERGVTALDLGGGGDYKRKYGGRPICVPWLRTSRIPGTEAVRTGLAKGYALRQRRRGAQARHAPG